jgi:hypothetical protein
VTHWGPAAPRRLVACAVAVLLLGLASGCGGGAGNGQPTGASTGTHGRAAIADWNSKTQELCRQKRAAIANLGSVHITYGGIARLGLPAVKRLLERYLDRLLSVLRRFATRQRALTTPPSRVSIMTEVRALDGQLQAATVHLRSAVAHVMSAAGLSSAFRAWLVTLQHLSARGEALARQLNLPACETGSTPGT